MCFGLFSPFSLSYVECWTCVCCFFLYGDRSYCCRSTTNLLCNRSETNNIYSPRNGSKVDEIREKIINLLKCIRFISFCFPVEKKLMLYWPLYFEVYSFLFHSHRWVFLTEEFANIARMQCHAMRSDTICMANDARLIGFFSSHVVVSI